MKARPPEQKKIAEALLEIRLSLGGIEKDLAYHIKRSDLLERRSDQMEATLESMIAELTKLKGFAFYAALIFGASAAILTLITQLKGLL